MDHDEMEISGESESRELTTLDETETETIEAEAIGPLEGVRVPVVALKAALMCADTKDREYLQGVHIASRCALDAAAEADHDEVRISGTDGHRLFAFSEPSPGEKPAWLKDGVIISRELLKEKLAMIEKIGGEYAFVSYAKGAPRIELSDPKGNVVFRSAPVDGTFPDYSLIFAKLNLAARSTVDLESSAFNAVYLKGVADLAKLLGSQSVQMFSSKPTDPVMMTFPQAPGAVLLLMPIKQDSAVISSATARVMDSTIAGTIAALKAHRTRIERKLAKLPTSKALQTKLAEYDQRIGAILARTAPALPAPSPDEDPEPIGEAADRPVAFVPAKPWAPDDAASPPPSLATTEDPSSTEEHARLRGLLKGRQRHAALTRYCADINAALSAKRDGLTLSQLADGVPVEEWWTGGLTPDEAAERGFTGWRTNKDMLSPDEYEPGQEFKRAPAQETEQTA